MQTWSAPFVARKALDLNDEMKNVMRTGASKPMRANKLGRDATKAKIAQVSSTCLG